MAALEAGVEGHGVAPAVSGGLGELLTVQKATVGLNRGAAGSVVTGAIREPVKDTRPTLADAGIDKKLSAGAQKRRRG